MPQSDKIKAIKKDLKNCDGFVYMSLTKKESTLITQENKEGDVVGNVLLNTCTNNPNFLGLLKAIIKQADFVLEVRKNSKQPEIITSSK